MLPKSKYFIVNVLFLFLVFSCTTSKTKKELKEDTTIIENNVSETATKEYNGQIVSENFTNKVGKEISKIQDLYFQINKGERYFIKFENSVISFKEAASFIGKDLKIQAKIIEGLWDVSDDNPQEAQSRMGYYIVIEHYEIIIE